VIRDILLMPFALLASKRVVHFQAAGVARTALRPALNLVVSSQTLLGAIRAYGIWAGGSGVVGHAEDFLIPNGVEDLICGLMASIKRQPPDLARRSPLPGQRNANPARGIRPPD
jgi:hypothetical protein